MNQRPFSFTKSRNRLCALASIVFQVLLLHGLYAQEDEIFKLKAKWQSSETDTAQIEALHSLCYEFFNSSIDSAVFYARECHRLGLTTESSKHRAIAQTILGTSLMYLSRYDSAEHYYTAALQTATEGNRAEQLSALYSNFGVLYKRQGMYDQAAKSYIDGLLIDEKNGNHYGMLIKKINLSNLYSDISDDERALEYGYEALETVERIERDNKPYIKALILNNIGAIFVEQDSLGEALLKFEEALAINREIDNQNEISRNLNNIGAIYEKMGRTEQGLPMLIEALKIRTEVGDKVGIIETSLQLGSSYAKLRDPALSQQYFETALDLAQELDSDSFLAQIYMAMSKASKQGGNFESALAYLEQYQMHGDSMDAKYDREAYLEMESKYQAAQKDAKIAQQDLTITKQNARRNKYLFSISGLLAGLGFLLYRFRKNKLFNRERIENLNREHKLAAVNYMIEGQEKERERVARDLHDGLGGFLSSIKMKIEGRRASVNGDSGDNVLVDAGTMIDDACAEVRRIAHDMMPGALAQLGLSQAIEDLAEDVAEGSDMEIAVIGFDQDLKLSEKLRVNLYRIIQEAVNNAIKYSRAKQIIVELVKKEDSMELSISDNGIGYDLESTKVKGDGIGIKNIEARAAYLDAVLEVETEPRKGCKYRIIIPSSEH